MSGMIYFDNAATTYPKPQTVVSAVTDAIIYKGGNAGRGSHRLSESAAELLYDTRETAADFFGAEPENVVFTSNATQALNYAIKGLSHSGYKILIDNFSHNAVYRPSVALSKNGFCRLEIYDSSGSDENTLDEICRRIVPGKTVVVATHQSNICSKILPIHEIGKLCREKNCYFVVDASQSAGHIPVSVAEDGITALCMPGHKGLFGIMGSGLLISAPEVKYNTLIEGGAGIASLDKGMPDTLPERLEAGTVALPAIASVKAGIEYIKKTGLDGINCREKRISERFVRNIYSQNKIRLHGNCTGPVVSFTVDGHTPAQIGELLNKNGICVRTGYHCAPLAHKTVGTLDSGSVRVSFSHLNTASEADRLSEILLSLKQQM